MEGELEKQKKLRSTKEVEDLEEKKRRQEQDIRELKQVQAEIEAEKAARRRQQQQDIAELKQILAENENRRKREEEKKRQEIEKKRREDERIRQQERVRREEENKKLYQMRCEAERARMMREAAQEQKRYAVVTERREEARRHEQAGRELERTAKIEEKKRAERRAMEEHEQRHQEDERRTEKFQEDKAKLFEELKRRQASYSGGTKMSKTAVGWAKTASWSKSASWNKTASLNTAATWTKTASWTKHADWKTVKQQENNLKNQKKREVEEEVETERPSPVVSPEQMVPNVDQVLVDDAIIATQTGAETPLSQVQRRQTRMTQIIEKKKIKNKVHSFGTMQSSAQRKKRKRTSLKETVAIPAPQANRKKEPPPAQISEHETDGESDNEWMLELDVEKNSTLSKLKQKALDEKREAMRQFEETQAILQERLPRIPEEHTETTSSSPPPKAVDDRRSDRFIPVSYSVEEPGQETFEEVSTIVGKSLFVEENPLDYYDSPNQFPYSYEWEPQQPDRRTLLGFSYHELCHGSPEVVPQQETGYVERISTMLAELPPEKPSNDWRDHISVEELLSSEIVSASASTVTEDYAEDVGFDSSPPTTQIPTPPPRTSVATASRTPPAPVPRAVPTPASRTPVATASRTSPAPVPRAVPTPAPLTASAPVSRAVPTPALRTDTSLAPQTLPPPEEKKYKAVEVTSRKGVRESALYQLEDDPDHCLRFLYKGTSKKTGIVTYHCLSCKQTKTDVLNGEFDQDPMEIPHVCGKALRSYHKERTNSMLYEETQELRTSDQPKLPFEAYTVMFAKIAANTEFSHDDRLKIGDILAQKGYNRHKSGLCKARLDNPAWATTMIKIEEQYKTSLIDIDVGPPHGPPVYVKDNFVQYHDEDLLICYSSIMFAEKNANKSPWKVIVADGCHAIRPAELGRNGQLYTIHGVTENGTSAPLLHAFTNSKTAAAYEALFQIVKDQLEQFGVDTDTLTIVTDYEKSALVAIDKIFNKENCQGCSFHFCMAFNRRARTLDIYIERIPVIARWIDRLRALMFFPDDKDLVQKSGVLKIPVPERHEAYDDCKSFLQYFQSTWMTGINAGRWQKFLQQTNRTSNIAESMHRTFRRKFKSPYPPLGETLDFIRSYQARQFHALRVDDPEISQQFLDNREIIQQLMEEFNDRWQKGEAEQSVILQYLDNMAEYTTKKCV